MGQFVDVSGTTKGKGYAGVIKRHHFSHQYMSHGNSLSHRAPGAIGQRQTPGRVFPGKRMAGRLGADKVTKINLEVVKVDAERNLLLVKGAVPGSENGQVVVRPAVKAPQSGQITSARDRAMKVKVQGGSGTLELADATFGAAFNEPLVHQVVTAYLAGATRRHEGAKDPRRSQRQRQEAVEAERHGPRPCRLDPQPDLGRRRPRVRGAPAQLRAEGQPQDVPRRDALGVVRAAAPRAAGRDAGARTFGGEDERASRQARASSSFTTGLIVVEAFDMKLWLAARNLPNVDVLEAQLIDPVSLVGADKVVITAAALKIVEERLR